VGVQVPLRAQLRPGRSSMIFRALFVPAVAVTCGSVLGKGP
jgi:hypothetical protein